MIRYIVLTTARLVYSRHRTLTAAYLSETRGQAAGHGTWIEAVPTLGRAMHVGECAVHVGERIILSDREHAAREDCRLQRQNAHASVTCQGCHAEMACCSEHVRCESCEVIS